MESSSSSVSKALIDAARKGSLTDVNRLLLSSSSDSATRSLNVNATDSLGWTALHAASRCGHDAVVEVLLKHAAVDVNVTESRVSNTPLHLAVLGGHLDVCKLLLRYGADPNAVNDDGDTPLHIATERFEMAIVMLLLDHDVNVNVRNRWGRTSLFWPCKLGSIEMVLVLLEMGESVNAQDNEGYTPLSEAMRYGHKALVQLLLEAEWEANINIRVPNSLDGWHTPLHWVIHRGEHQDHNNKMLRHILGLGADVNAVNHVGNTPLHVALALGDVESYQVLLDWGADIHVHGEDGLTPLHVACQHHHHHHHHHHHGGHNSSRMEEEEDMMITRLIQLDADVNARDHRGATPLHVSCRTGNRRVVRLLLELGGASVHVQAHAAATGGGHGCTPLHVACFRGDVDLVQLLLQHGARVDATDAVGQTPLWPACAHGHTDVVNLLLEHAGTDPEIILTAAANQHETGNNNNNTPLQVAAEHGHLPVVQQLVLVCLSLSRRSQS